LKTITFWSSLKEETRSSYTAIFEKEWPKWLAGILLAIVALLLFLWHSPWGVANGYKNWGDWVFYLAGAADERPVSPLLHPVSLTNIGLLLGALVSALMSRQFKVRRAPLLEYLKGLVAGILMGTGAVLAAGCNVGGFYSALGMLDTSGAAMMAGMLIGSLIGLRYLLWEMEHMPQRTIAEKPPRSGFVKVQPILGGAIIVLIVLTFYLYGALDKTELGGLIFFGFLIGLIMHRSRFCFVRAFRCPFMTGDAEMVKVVAMSLVIYAMGSAVIKWSWVQDPAMGVMHHFWFGSFVGGIVFGVGMLIAGGCATSTLWRMGEGHLKLLVTMVSFAVTISLVTTVLKSRGLYEKLGQGQFLPDVLTWHLTVPLFVLMCVLWAVVAIWNEKSEKFVIF
jgi:uncharacterized membrane protein YedE/YeeE